MVDISEIFDPDNPLMIDLDDFTLNEQKEVEDLGGASLFTVLASTRPTVQMLQALLFVTARKLSPDITFAEVGEAKPGTYGWKLEPDEGGELQIPFQGLAALSPGAYASTRPTSNSVKKGGGTVNGAKNGNKNGPKYASRIS